MAVLLSVNSFWSKRLRRIYTTSHLETGDWCKKIQTKINIYIELFLEITQSAV